MAWDMGLCWQSCSPEQGIEHRLGDEVLGQHLDDFAIGDAVVQVVAQFLGKGVEGGDLAFVGRVFHNGGDAG
jgi:hypothetical protein